MPPAWAHNSFSEIFCIRTDLAPVHVDSCCVLDTTDGDLLNRHAIPEAMVESQGIPDVEKEGEDIKNDENAEEASPEMLISSVPAFKRVSHTTQGRHRENRSGTHPQ
jgi:hypothetical protein